MERNQSFFCDNEYSDANAKYRWISRNHFDLYLDAIFNHTNLHAIENVLDVGCGTGQFAFQLARRFPFLTIDALDFSKTQLQKLNTLIQSNGVNNIDLINSSIFDYQTSKKYDLIICSEIVHLIDDFEGFANKLSQMISPIGIICIRTPSPYQYSTRSIYKFFPRIKYLNLLHCKGPELINAAFELFGMSILETYTIDESKNISSSELHEMFSSKSFSTLQLLSNQEYKNGMNALEQFLSVNEEYYYNFEMSCYIVGLI